jgi:hypothetical protein
MLLEESREIGLCADFDDRLTLDFEIPDFQDREARRLDRDSNLKNFVTTINEERITDDLEPVEWGDKPWGSFSNTQISGDMPPPAPRQVAPPAGTPAEPPAAGQEPEKPEEGKALPAYENKGRPASWWTPERKAAHWKAFEAKTSEWEPMFAKPVRKHFKQQEQEVLSALEPEGKKVIGALAGFGREKKQAWLKTNADKINTILPDRDTWAAKLARACKCVYLVVMEEAGQARTDDLAGTKAGAKALELKKEGDFNVNDPKVLKWLGKRLEKFSEQVEGTTFDEIKAILREGFTEGKGIPEIAQTLRDKFESYDKYRANTIARTEVVGSANKADLEAVDQMGIADKLLKHWGNEPDARPTHVQAGNDYADGIGIDENFKVGDDEMDAPGNGQLAEENVNCRCVNYFSEKE